MSAPHMPMMNEHGLLECDNCGGLRVVPCAVPHGWIIECLDCSKKSEEFVRLRSARGRWNTRGGHLYTADDFNQAASERDYGL